ncbi:cob(I)yrinic acid a,c-diamide adenosyltransferase, partial [Candidatus Woesebacteria bacterium]|nr:cob(I)yrinic acid a,c-diamide adenosyltransferase [Candidatus Woesebacteria bacterium]
MSIATKTGDKGDTGLFGGRRVKKYDPQVEAYGAIDEATCFIGLAYESISKPSIRQLVTDIQYNLYIIMAYLSDGPMDHKKITDHLKIVEDEIVHLEKTLPQLTRFILPQGSEEAARLQIARAMIRSSERRVVSFIDTKNVQSKDDALILKYLNRLSDLF